MSNAVLRSVGGHSAVPAPPKARHDKSSDERSRLTPRRRRLRQWGMLAGVLTLFGTALFLLHRELARYSYRNIAQAVRDIPTPLLILAGAATAASYALLFGYDWLALRYVGRRLTIRRTALASFIAYAFSQSLGVSALTGASVRFRFWSAWGLSPEEIAQGVAFTTAAFWLGASTLGGLAALAAGGVAPGLVPPVLSGVGGVLLLLPAVAYLVWVGRGRPTLALRRWSLHPPAPRLAVAQIVVASLDWTLAGVALYLVLPHDGGLTLARLLGAFLIAQMAGLASHVPGGVGVFDTTMLVLLERYAPVPRIAASLLAYRFIYYLLPLGAATIAFAAHEMTVRRRMVTRAVRIVGRVVASSAPFWLSGATFVAGVLLLASGSTPSVHSRLRFLDALFPLAVIELSHFAASVVGVVLLLVANGLRRRLDAAWHVAVALLAVGIGASLLKGGDYEEALTLAIVLGALLPARRHFYRRAALLAEPLSAGWMVAVTLAIAATTWLGIFSFKHVPYRASMWWRFATTADAPRFLRATVGVAVVLIGYAMARLLRPSRARTVRPSPAELARAGEVVSAAGSGDPYLALLGDKSLLFSKSGRGLLMYGVHRDVWVALGDPVATPGEARQLVWEFCEQADAHGGYPAFYEIGHDSLPMYVDLGLSLVKVGEEARVSLPSFALDGGGRKGLRRALRDGERAGLSLQIVRPPFQPLLMEELAALSDAWLAERHTREKGFSLGFFDVDYLERFPLALVWQGSRVVAFANLWMSAGNQELSVDLMRHVPDAPDGVMDFLFLRLMLWGREAGFSWFNLGMAPLSGFETHSLAPLWSRLGALVYRHGEHFYNFRGLRQYKEKFDPVWTPKYLASPGGWRLPVVLGSIAALIGGGFKGVVAK